MVQAKRWQRGPSSATSTLPQAGQKSSIAGSAAPTAPSGATMAAEPEEELAHAEVLELFQEALARLVQDPLLCDLPPQVGPGPLGAGRRPRGGGGAQARFIPRPRPCRPQVTAEEIGSQVALEYGQAMTVRVCKADGETMRGSRGRGAGAGRGRGPRS